VVNHFKTEQFAVDMTVVRVLEDVMKRGREKRILNFNSHAAAAAVYSN
jgi:hypothetical protein